VKRYGFLECEDGWGGGEEGAEELPERAAWRAEGTALAEAGRRRAVSPRRRPISITPASSTGAGRSSACGARSASAPRAGACRSCWRKATQRFWRSAGGWPPRKGSTRARGALAQWRDVGARHAAMAEAVRALFAQTAASSRRREQFR